MADITAKLIAYRLSESFTNMANWYSEVAEWYQHEFSWRSVEILDMLVLGWVLLALVVVGLINIYLHFFGPWRKGLSSRGKGLAPAVGVQDSAGETCHWVNAAISWLHSQTITSLRLSDSWLQALNKESEKNPVSICACLISSITCYHYFSMQIFDMNTSVKPQLLLQCP